MNSLEPDLSKVQPWSEFLSLQLPDPLDREYGEKYYSRATDFLKTHTWCADIKESYIGILSPKIIAVYLFRIVNRDTFGDWVWVIVGDIPPAVLPIAAGNVPAMALDAYLGEMDVWVEAVDKGRPIDDLIPVNAPPTKEYAERLRWRLDFIGEKILMADYEDDLGYDPDEQQ
jgi:hypothetical protein